MDEPFLFGHRLQLVKHPDNDVLILSLPEENDGCGKSIITWENRFDPLAKTVEELKLRTIRLPVIISVRKGTRTQCGCAFGKVEMAGIEPASERLDPRKSTSVAG
jgi:hypothetical protein